MKKMIMMMAVVAVLSGCGLTKEKLGIANQAPDETKVTTRQPLSVPPEFDLRPVVEVVEGE